MLHRRTGGGPLRTLGRRRGSQRPIPGRPPPFRNHFTKRGVELRQELQSQGHLDIALLLPNVRHTAWDTGAPGAMCQRPIGLTSFWICCLNPTFYMKSRVEPRQELHSQGQLDIADSLQTVHDTAWDTGAPGERCQRPIGPISFFILT